MWDRTPQNARISKGVEMKEQDNFCTAFPDNIRGTDISQCCKAHDDAYSVNTTITRHEADVNLMNCVKEAFPTNTFLAVVIPLLMYAGVRVAGRLFYKKNN